MVPRIVPFAVAGLEKRCFLGLSGLRLRGDGKRRRGRAESGAARNLPRPAVKSHAEVRSQNAERKSSAAAVARLGLVLRRAGRAERGRGDAEPPLQPEHPAAARGAGRGPAALEAERPARLRSAISGKDHRERRGDRVELVRGGARRQGDGGDARRPGAGGVGLPQLHGGGAVRGDRAGDAAGPGGGGGATTRRRRSTCATVTRRTTSGACAAAATGWSGTSICSSRARGRGGEVKT